MARVLKPNLNLSAYSNLNKYRMSCRLNRIIALEIIYSFSRLGLVQSFLSGKVSKTKKSTSLLASQCKPSKIYYHWSPFPGWRFISVDSYGVSLIGYSSSENQRLAKELPAKHNPNDLKISGTWFNNLPYNKRRWVPYNGGNRIVSNIEYIELI